MAKNTTPTAKPKADIDFENELWNAANELRGAVAENQYKDYVLSLLFVRMLISKIPRFAGRAYRTAIALRHPAQGRV